MMNLNELNEFRDVEKDEAQFFIHKTCSTHVVHELAEFMENALLNLIEEIENNPDQEEFSDQVKLSKFNLVLQKQESFLKTFHNSIDEILEIPENCDEINFLLTRNFLTKMVNANEKMKKLLEDFIEMKFYNESLEDCRKILEEMKVLKKNLEKRKSIIRKITQEEKKTNALNDTMLKLRSEYVKSYDYSEKLGKVFAPFADKMVEELKKIPIDIQVQSA